MNRAELLHLHSFILTEINKQKNKEQKLCPLDKVASLVSFI